ncbi:YfaZ family outer membrane protein [Solimonas soli]|uniref:YfaZ family outer membrane protein n=1 Tax=Solimonas soli TaxID=413479 RepID=UPI0004B0A0BE|nr:YfaZ family outer membrane protein [Solimonas soli]
MKSLLMRFPQLCAPLAAMGLALAAGAAQAETVDFSLSGDSFRFGLNGPLSRLIGGAEGQYDVGYLQHRDDGEDSYAVHAGFLVTGDAGLRDLDLKVGAGLRGVYIGGDGDNGGAIAPGVKFDARLPGYERLALTGYVWYAPSVVSFGDIDSYRDLGIAVSYELNRNAAIYLGARNVKFGVDGGPDVTLDTGLYGGIALTF